MLLGKRYCSCTSDTSKPDSGLKLRLCDAGGSSHWFERRFKLMVWGPVLLLVHTHEYWY